MSRLLWATALLCSLGASRAHADDVVLSNTGNIIIPASGNSGSATPYPSIITATNVTGLLRGVEVTLNGLNHTYTGDVNVMLVSPIGQNLILMATNCDEGAATNATLTFSDAASSTLPTDTFSLTGASSWKPSRNGPIEFNPPAPLPSSNTTLSAFNGVTPNGQWRLFVYDNYSLEDGGNISGGWSLRLITGESVPPTVAYNTPSANQKIAIASFGAGSISGTATDNIGVTNVKVRISRKRNNQNEFWNGTAWITNSLTFVDATVTGAGTPNVSWSLNANVPPTNELDAGLYGVRVYSLDAAGNKSANVDRFFTLFSPVADTTIPSVTINSPTSNQIINVNSFTTSSLSGVASDNVGVTRVRLKLQRKRGTTTTYWNGSSFVEVVSTFDAALSQVGALSVSWQLAEAIPASAFDKGGYTLYATAFDAAGNFKTSPSRIFNIIGTPAPPTAAAASSANGS